MQPLNFARSRVVSVRQTMIRYWYKIPTLYATEDFEGTEALLRAEVLEGWQEPKGEAE